MGGQGIVGGLGGRRLFWVCAGACCSFGVVGVAAGHLVFIMDAMTER